MLFGPDSFTVPLHLRHLVSEDGLQMDPTALEAQERRHQESLTAMMERKHGLFLEANRGREPAVQPAVPQPRVGTSNFTKHSQHIRGPKVRVALWQNTAQYSSSYS
ncbi:UNVERIFIED_CONTAM: hypothetical protein FKN15_067427 [Acipenser sinensis]